MKKAIIFVVVLIIVLLGVGGTLLFTQKTAFAPSRPEGTFNITNRNEPPSLFSSPYGDVQAPGPAKSITVADLADYFNQRLAYSLPKGSTEKFFTQDFKATSGNKQYGDPTFEIFDFTGDGKTDAMIVIPFLSQAGWTDMYVLSSDPMVVSESTIDNINSVFGTSGSKVSKEEMKKFGPGKTIQLSCVDDSCKTTLGWSASDRDGYKTIQIIR
jgi:hypothetical protein